MATTQINTESTQYQTRLTQLQEIKAFYGPIIVKYLGLRDPERQKAWRQRDPILRELLDIHRKIESNRWQ